MFTSNVSNGVRMTIQHYLKVNHGENLFAPLKQERCTDVQVEV